VKRPLLPQWTASHWTAFAAAESGRFILFLPVCMAGGVIAYFAWPREPPAWPAALMAAICLIAGLLRIQWPAMAVLLCAGAAAGGFACAALKTARAPAWPVLPRHAVVVRGVIASLDVLPEGRRVTLAGPVLDDLPPLQRALRIRLRNTDGTALSVGDDVRLRALLRPPSPPAYPGGWDTQRDAFFSGLGGYGFAIGDAEKEDQIFLSEENKPKTFATPAPCQPGHGCKNPKVFWFFFSKKNSLASLRANIANQILTALPGTPGAIAATLLTGTSTAIPPADRGAFQDSGLAHLLAVAGLHIGIVMGLVYAAVRRGLAFSEHAALHWPLKQSAALAALAAGFGYLELTGAHVPILRSFAMASLVTLAILTGRRAISLRGLALAAFVLMAAAPHLVMGVSFQMSFAAVMALIAGWDVLAPYLARLHGPGLWRPPARHAAALVATSLLAGTASLPVAAYHFGNATLYYVPANLLAVPVTALWVMPWGLAALALMPCGLHGLALAPMGWGISLLLWIAHGVAAWPDARLPLPQAPPAALILFVAGLCWICLWRSRIRLAGAALMALGLCTAWLTPLPDGLVSADARLIALRIHGRVFVSAAKGVSRFDREAPARIWGAAYTEAFPPEGQAATEGPWCSAADCRALLPGGLAVLLKDDPRQSGPDASCPQAAIILSHAALACDGRTVIDRDAVRRHGAATLRLTRSGPVVTWASDDRTARPWAAPPPNAPPPALLPPALTE
jgi:competence protein ComEC